MYGPVEAEPYAWPFDGAFDVARTAVVCIDWQVDFCGAGGYVDAMGYDLKLTRAGFEPTARVLAAVRPLGMMVVHTREGHLPSLADCPANKLWRSAHRCRHRRHRALRAHPGAGRAGVGHRSRGGSRGRRGRHRQAGKRGVLCHRA